MTIRNINIDERPARKQILAAVSELVKECILEQVTVEAHEVSNHGTFEDGLLVGERKGINKAIKEIRQRFEIRGIEIK